MKEKVWWNIDLESNKPYCSKCGHSPKDNKITKYCEGCGNQMINFNSKEELEQFTCNVCGRTLPKNEFYKIHGETEYYIDKCKCCICEEIKQGHLLNICSSMDIPLVYKYIERYCEGADIPSEPKYWFDKYVSYMNLFSWRNYRYKDSDWFNAREEYRRSMIELKKQGINI